MWCCLNMKAHLHADIARLRARAASLCSNVATMLAAFSMAL